MTYGGKNSIKYIMIHQTANTSKGANANAHARLQANGNSRQASWHYSVGSDGIYQSFPDTAQAWHAGNKYYNQNSIGIELCVNSDGNYNKTIELGAELTKYLMDKHNVPLSRVIRHKDASGKHCPRELLNGKNGITWAKFKQIVQGASTPKPAPSKPSKPANKTIEQLADEVIAGKHGTGEARKKSLGSNYSAVQALVNKKLGGNKSKPRPKKTINQMAQEVIAGKHGTGHENRRKSLGISQSEYDKVRAEVNRLAGVKTGLTVEQMANKIINDKNAPTGHEARRKWLGIDNATYQKVRARVNQKLR